jgi:hypothetical protein
MQNQVVIRPAGHVPKNFIFGGSRTVVHDFRNPDPGDYLRPGAYGLGEREQAEYEFDQLMFVMHGYVDLAKRYGEPLDSYFSPKSNYQVYLRAQSDAVRQHVEVTLAERARNTATLQADNDTTQTQKDTTRQAKNDKAGDACLGVFLLVCAVGFYLWQKKKKRLAQERS